MVRGNIHFLEFYRNTRVVFKFRTSQTSPKVHCMNGKVVRVLYDLYCGTSQLWTKSVVDQVSYGTISIITHFYGTDREQ